MTKINWKTIGIIGLIVVIAGYFIAQIIITERLENTRSTIESQQAEQRALLLGIAEITARNGADEITALVLQDCPTEDRKRFDELLGQLNSGLPQQELIELDQLFTQCGMFYAERKLLMVSRLAREIEVYKAYTNQLSAITDKDQTASAQIQQWEELATLEREQSELFNQLVILQERIITTLLDEKSLESEEIKAILSEVAEVQGNLLLKTQQATSVRNELISV